MSARNRVVWNEGLFIKPQHFQQQQRNIEYQLDERIGAINRYFYGISEITLNTEYLSFGRIALESASGVMPDGSVFRLPQEDSLPEALEINDYSLVNHTVYLAVALRSDVITEISWPDAAGSGRYQSKGQEIRDIHTQQGAVAQIEVSPVKVRLMLEKDDRSAYASIAIAQILEKRPDGSLMLNANFIPCHLNVRNISFLQRFVGEVSGLLRERAKNIAQRLGAQNQGGVADVSDFMLLQALNRMQAQLQHLAHLRSLHPERLYESLSIMCAELATFIDESRMVQKLGSYQHDDPTSSFLPLMSMLRQQLSAVLEPRAVSIQLQKRKYGLMVAPLQDTSLLQSAEFILAVRARIPLEDLRKLFVQQTKISSVEKIRELISLQLPGIPLSPLPVAPRQLPYHAGYTYFQLDKSNASWDMVANSSGFAFHIAGDFPGLDLEFWAIRSQS